MNYMSKIYVFLALILPLSIYSQETYVPDNYFESYLESNGMGNGINNDNYVLTENISNVLELNIIQSGNISDLTGIEDFDSLIELFIINSNISYLNMSSNEQLERLYVQQNLLDSINVENNINLTNLTVRDNNLSELNVSNNINLKSLSFSSNNITSIDLTNNILLEYLYCANSPLESLDLSQNINLIDFEIYWNENLYCVDVFDSITFTNNFIYSENQFGWPTLFDSTTSFSNNCNLYSGCLDSLANNYNINATINNYDCEYSSWECNNNSSCFEVLDNSGSFLSLQECENNCEGSDLIIGQWYADVGEFIEITSDTFIVYIFDELNQDCYEKELYEIIIDEEQNSFTLLSDDGDTANVNYFDFSIGNALSFSIALNNDTVNLVSTSFDPSNWIECDSIDCFDDNETIISIFGDFFINDCQILIDYLSFNYNYNLVEACNWNGGSMFDLDTNLIIGNICECTCNEDLETTTWKCFAGSCYELNDGTGEFDSLEDCEASCLINDTTYKCVESSCIEVYDTTGEFLTLDECEKNCETVTWECNADNECNEINDDSGSYLSLEECENNCNASLIFENNFYLNVYPNPSTNIFNIEMYLDHESKLTLTNFLGNIIYSKEIKTIGEFNTQIDLSNFSKGIYNLAIMNSNKLNNFKLILK